MKTLRESVLVSLLGAAAVAGCGGNNHAQSGATSSGAGGSSSSSSGTGGLGDPSYYMTAPSCCAYDCTGAPCSEKTVPYQCPATNSWASMPHLDACPTWDGTYPTPAAGKCSASAPTGAALNHTGPLTATPSVRVLPDGRAIQPAGSEWQFNEAAQQGGSTSAIAAVPGTTFVVTVDTGVQDHAVRVVDTTLIGKSNPVKGFIDFPPPSYLNTGVAVLASGRVYVATGYGVVQAFDVDLTTGALTRNDAASPKLPTSTAATSQGQPWYSSGVAASPDGKRLVVTPVFDTLAFVIDIDPTSPTYLKQLGQVDLGQKETFGAWFDPNDPTGTFAYVSMWAGRKVVELNVGTPTKPTMARTFTTDKNPEGVAFLNARWMAVANDFGETISMIDRTSGTVTSVPVTFEKGLAGLDVSGVAWDATNNRLYASLSGIDAIAAFGVDLTATPPTVTPIGKLQGSWWPTGMVVGASGALTVSNLRGHPIGAFPVMAGGDGYYGMKGSVQQIPFPSAGDLTAGDAQVTASVGVGVQAGYPTVTCPQGANDFPVPSTNTAGPSTQIQHVFFIVRENKTFDSLFGDIPGVDGDPTVMMKATTAEMDQVWPNGRQLARTFTTGDNYYTLAVQSTQGHSWTTYGRATDFCERTWSDELRAEPLCGISDVGRPDPVQASLFEWLQSNNVHYSLLGEIVGQPTTAPAGYSPIDISYPGGPFQNITYCDLEKSCYTAARLRVSCDLGSFVYMTLPNDHTVGVSSMNPSPDTMCAVNDEATGMFIDALSHSPIWASSLVVLTEDDPQSGGDHIDYHRTPLVLISPWVKRGYVTKTHIDVASLHKTFAHLLGLPYQNLVVANAGIPFDAFTSTPDYTPFTYQPHKITITCGMDATEAEQRLTSSWDFSNADAQPGLGDQVRRYMRHEQWKTLPPRVEAEIEAREARRAKGLAPLEDDDD